MLCIHSYCGHQTIACVNGRNVYTITNITSCWIINRTTPQDVKKDENLIYKKKFPDRKLKLHWQEWSKWSVGKWGRAYTMKVFLRLCTLFESVDNLDRWMMCMKELAVFVVIVYLVIFARIMGGFNVIN